MAKYQFRFGETYEPLPEAIYKLKIDDVAEQDFSTGSWGMQVNARVVEGQYGGKPVRTQIPLIKDDGSTSGAFFRFAKLYNTVMGEDPVIEVESIEEFKELLRSYASNLKGRNVEAEIVQRTMESGNIVNDFGRIIG